MFSQCLNHILSFFFQSRKIEFPILMDHYKQIRGKLYIIFIWLLVLGFFFWENVFFLNLKEVASLWFIYIMWNDKSLEAFWLLFEVYVNLIIFFSLKLIGFWMEGKSSCNVWFLKLNSGWLFLSNSPIILILVNKIRRGLHWLL